MAVAPVTFEYDANMPTMVEIFVTAHVSRQQKTKRLLKQAGISYIVKDAFERLGVF